MWRPKIEWVCGVGCLECMWVRRRCGVRVHFIGHKHTQKSARSPWINHKRTYMKHVDISIYIYIYIHTYTHICLDGMNILNIRCYWWYMYILDTCIQPACMADALLHYCNNRTSGWLKQARAYDVLSTLCCFAVQQDCSWVCSWVQPICNVGGCFWCSCCSECMCLSQLFSPSSRAANY